MPFKLSFPVLRKKGVQDWIRPFWLPNTWVKFWLLSDNVIIEMRLSAKNKQQLFLIFDAVITFIEQHSQITFDILWYFSQDHPCCFLLWFEGTKNQIWRVYKIT